MQYYVVDSFGYFVQFIYLYILLFEIWFCFLVVVRVISMFLFMYLYQVYVCEVVNFNCLRVCWRKLGYKVSEQILFFKVCKGGNMLCIFLFKEIFEQGYFIWGFILLFCRNLMVKQDLSELGFKELSKDFLKVEVVV